MLNRPALLRFMPLCTTRSMEKHDCETRICHDCAEAAMMADMAASTASARRALSVMARLAKWSWPAPPAIITQAPTGKAACSPPLLLQSQFARLMDLQSKPHSLPGVHVCRSHCTTAANCTIEPRYQVRPPSQNSCINIETFDYRGLFRWAATLRKIRWGQKIGPVVKTYRLHRFLDI